MFCTVCGAQIADGVKFCTSCGAPTEKDSVSQPQSEPVTVQPVQAAAAPQPAIPQPAAPSQGFDPSLAQAADELQQYCKIDMDPKPSNAIVIIFAVIGLLMLIIGIAGAPFMIVLGILLALFGILARKLAYDGNVKRATRLKNIFEHDGEENVLREFAAAEKMAKDKFRMSTGYIFGKRSEVFRIMDIQKVTRVVHSTNGIPTNVTLEVNISDETGSGTVQLCTLSLGKSKNQANEIYEQIVNRQEYIKQQYLNAHPELAQQ